MVSCVEWIDRCGGDDVTLESCLTDRWLECVGYVGADYDVDWCRSEIVVGVAFGFDWL